MTDECDFLPGRASAAKLSVYVELFQRSLIRSRLRGDPGNWFELERALHRVSAKVAAETRLKVPEWAYQLELNIWLEVLLENVLEGPLVRVVDEIDGMRLTARGPETPDPGVWTPLALKVTSDRIVHRNRMATEAALLGAYRLHLEKPSAVRMRDAIAALRDLQEQSLPSILCHGVAVLTREGEYLAHALGQVLPSTARLLLATGVRRLFEGALESVPVRELPESMQTDWFRRYPGLDRWYPVWVGVEKQAWKEPCEETAPKLFGPEAQELYVEWVGNRERKIRGQKQAFTRRTHEPDEPELMPGQSEDSAANSASVDPEDRDEQTAEGADLSATPDQAIEEFIASERFVTIHVLEDGFIPLGYVLPRGYELTVDRNSLGWQVTLDQEGNSWVDETEAQQERSRGKVYFRHGHWPGPGKPSGVGVVSANGFIERSHADKQHPIERPQAIPVASQDRTFPDNSGHSRAHLLDPIRPRPSPWATQLGSP